MAAMPQLIALFFVATVALTSALLLPERQAQGQVALADAGATSLLAYRQGVVDFLNAHATFTGTVPDTAITFPWGYVRDPRWSNRVEAGGTLYVFEAAAHSPHTDQVLDQLYRKTLRSFTVGRNVAGQLVGATGMATGIAVPASVPDGALLMVGR
jgi:hypothetical protein